MTRSVLVFGFVAIGIFPLAARAALLTGELNFTGSAIISLDSFAINNGHVFNISPAIMQQGDFVALGGTTGSIKDITNPPYATGVIFPTPNFITFAAAPNISLTMLELIPGTDGAAGCADTPAAAGQACTPITPGEDQFNLLNSSATSSTASFSILANEVDTLTNTSMLVPVTFTIPLTTMNFQQFLTTVNGGGAVTTSFSGEVFADAPEPSTWVELLIGISALGPFLIRAGQRAKNRLPNK